MSVAVPGQAQEKHNSTPLANLGRTIELLAVLNVVRAPRADPFFAGFGKLSLTAEVLNAGKQRQVHGERNAGKD